MHMIYLLVLICVLGSTLAFYIPEEYQRDANGLEEHRRCKRGIIDGSIRAIWNAVPKELVKRSLSAAFTALRTIANRVFTRSVRSVAAAEEHAVAPELTHEVGTVERVAEQEAVHEAQAVEQTAEQEVLQEPVNPVNNQPGPYNDEIWISNDAGNNEIDLFNDAGNTEIDLFNDLGNTEIDLPNDLGNTEIDFFNDLGNIHIDDTNGPSNSARGLDSTLSRFKRSQMVVCPITACGEGSMMDDFVDEEMSYLNTMLMMQENISSHLKMKQGIEVVPDAPVPTTAFSINDLDTSAETVVAMELMQINIEDCLCLIRIGGLLQDIVDDKAMLVQISANVNIVTSYYWEAREALDRLKEDYQNSLPIIQDADVHSRIEEREELTSHLDSHLARLARDRSNEEFLLENIDKLKKKREKSVLWDLISD